jgi:hypothetical protein
MDQKYAKTSAKPAPDNRFPHPAFRVHHQRISVERGEVFVLIELPLLPKIEFENNQHIHEIQNRRLTQMNADLLLRICILKIFMNSKD